AIDGIRGSRSMLDAARANLLEVVERIQRETKAAANVAYPVAAPLPVIRAALGEGEALVSYALLSREAFALVVTRDGARIVALGPTKELERIAATLAAIGPEGPAEDAIEAARTALLRPLGVDRARRLLVSPDGALAYVPFALLAPAQEIAHVPSGTTYTVLLEEASRRGEAVLALGDPETGAAVALLHGQRLASLPGSREEAKGVGDVVLLGADATEPGFRSAVAKRPRWRAVHFACHGLVDPERPLLASLALTPGGGEDGFLTAAEVLRSRIPADLVVLSACETAKGKVYKAEGVVGFTRAFMAAGAPRVLVSLWNVDDDATRVLMAKFYEGWKGELGGAAALKAAQEHVRAQEKWRHPYYWAAWQLWGVPE
ncbi:MAG: CHAT domain-containing protein, partial [Planctomycetota bacterium]